MGNQTREMSFRVRSLDEENKRLKGEIRRNKKNMAKCKHTQLIIHGGETRTEGQIIKCNKCGREWYYCLDGWAHYQLKSNKKGA